MPPDAVRAISAVPDMSTQLLEFACGLERRVERRQETLAKQRVAPPLAARAAPVPKLQSSNPEIGWFLLRARASSPGGRDGHTSVRLPEPLCPNQPITSPHWLLHCTLAEPAFPAYRTEDLHRSSGVV